MAAVPAHPHVAMTPRDNAPPSDERVRSIGPLRRFLSRPEFGSISGAVLVFALFAVSLDLLVGITVALVSVTNPRAVHL